MNFLLLSHKRIAERSPLQCWRDFPSWQYLATT
jgi:hypothetical protein